jgi:hypothetical protein
VATQRNPLNRYLSQFERKEAEGILALPHRACKDQRVVAKFVAMRIQLFLLQWVHARYAILSNDGASRVLNRDAKIMMIQQKAVRVALSRGGRR